MDTTPECNLTANDRKSILMCVVAGPIAGMGERRQGAPIFTRGGNKRRIVEELQEVHSLAMPMDVTQTYLIQGRMLRCVRVCSCLWLWF